MQACGVVTHPGFRSLPLPCLSLSGILLGPNLNTYCMKASEINNKQADRQNLLEPSFLELWQLFKFYFTPPLVLPTLLCLNNYLMISDA